MNPGSWIAAGAALAALAGAAPAQAASGGTFSVRNDTGRAMACAVRKTGGGYPERMRLRADEEWRQTYPKPKPRSFRCEDAAPIWYLLKSGIRYRLVVNRHGLIVLTPL